MAAQRRQSTHKALRERSPDRGHRTLKASMRKLNSLVVDLQRTIEAQSKRTAAIQAQVDHLDARVRGK
jgi:hypothetical protein